MSSQGNSAVILAAKTKHTKLLDLGRFSVCGMRSEILMNGLGGKHSAKFKSTVTAEKFQ